MKNEPKEGMRVHVYSADVKKYFGLGTIEKVEPLRIEEAGLTITTTFPSRIVLDSGDVTDGLHCWWSEVNEKEETNKKENAK